MIESLSFYCSFEILIHFKPMTWPHFIETARLVFVEPTWNKHPLYLHLVIFTVGKQDCCKVLRNKYFLYELLFCKQRAFGPLVGSRANNKKTWLTKSILTINTLSWKINSEMVFAKDQIHIVKAEDASYFSTIMSIGV